MSTSHKGRTAAIIGGGVIGGGWAARFLLMGWDVRVYDPDPEAKRNVGEVIENARRCLPGLSDVALPGEGRLIYSETLGDAVNGAIWVQESLPERLDLKHRVYRQIQDEAGGSVPIASSTSGYKPSALAEGSRHPEAIFVAHPFDPVYLLPLVELVSSSGTSPSFITFAEEILRSIRMHPIVIDKEIDAHISDRLQKAIWQEALWLVNDGVASTKEIDDAIRYGFGLRWAQMGLFETCRIAGGEGGIRDFIEQLGPCLASPSSKSLDAPDPTDELIDRIAEQSSVQCGRHSIHDLVRIRDTNLVAILRALKAQDWGAGALLNAQDRRMAETPSTEGAIVTVDRAVPLDWTDYNGHMNESRYLQAFSDASDRFMELIGCDAEYIASGSSYFTAETHIRHLSEVHAGAKIRVETLCLFGQGKKMHLFHQMFAGEQLLATGEHLLIHVSLKTRRASPPAPHIEAELQRIAALHAELPLPDGIGCAIGMQ